MKKKLQHLRNTVQNGLVIYMIMIGKILKEVLIKYFINFEENENITERLKNLLILTCYLLKNENIQIKKILFY